MEEFKIENHLTTNIKNLREEVFVVEQCVPIELEIEENEE